MLWSILRHFRTVFMDAQAAVQLDGGRGIFMFRLKLCLAHPKNFQTLAVFVVTPITGT